jgi:hypothetical protein
MLGGMTGKGVTAMRWIWLALLCVFAVAAHAEELWRWVDENGVVHYSDRPHPGAERIQLRAPQTFTPPPVQERPRSQPTDAEADAGPRYSGLRIESPAAGEMLWNIGGALPVQLSISPALSPDHQLRLFLDGRPVPNIPQATQFTINEVFRGEHQLRAAIVDGNGRELASSEAVTFYVQQTSIQNPNNPAARPRPTPRSGG